MKLKYHYFLPIIFIIFGCGGIKKDDESRITVIIESPNPVIETETPNEEIIEQPQIEAEKTPEQTIQKENERPPLENYRNVDPTLHPERRESIYY